MRLVELSRSEHAELRIRADLVEASAASQHLIPIVVSEFRKAATQYPIVFAKSPETGRFAPYVLNGLGVEENLFWSGTELDVARSEEHTSELQSQSNLVCRLLLEKKKKTTPTLQLYSLLVISPSS